MSGVDLIRDEHGEFRVLEDNLRNPSGVSYVIENRRVMARVFPDLFGAQPVSPVDDYPRRLLVPLRAVGPAAVAPPAHRGAHPGRRTTPPTSSTPCSPG